MVVDWGMVRRTHPQPRLSVAELSREHPGQLAHRVRRAGRARKAGRRLLLSGLAATLHLQEGALVVAGQFVRYCRRGYGAVHATPVMAWWIW